MAATHKNNRLALARYLEDHVSDDMYYHGSFGFLDDHEHCAGGWAAIAGIGGLHYVTNFRFEDSNGNCLSAALEHVFGKGSDKKIFNGNNHMTSRIAYKSRETVIKQLRAM